MNTEIGQVGSILSDIAIGREDWRMVTLARALCTPEEAFKWLVCRGLLPYPKKSNDSDLSAIGGVDSSGTPIIVERDKSLFFHPSIIEVSYAQTIGCLVHSSKL